MESLDSLDSPVSVDPVGLRNRIARLAEVGIPKGRAKWAIWVDASDRGSAAFLRFRTPLVHEMAEAAGRQGLDAAGATDLLEAVTVAVDRLLDATLEGYEDGALHDRRPARQGAPAR